MTYNDVLESPYDPEVRDTISVQKPLAEIIRMAVEYGALNLRVAMPAQIVSVGGNQQVDVQPMVLARYTFDNKTLPLPIVKNVPVVMMQGAQYAIKVPLAKGDNGLLVCCDRSIDAWSASQGTDPVDPQDTRNHELSDGVFFPGLVPAAKQTQDTTSDMTLSAGKAQLRLQQSGKMRLLSTDTGGQELFDLLDQLSANQAALCNVLMTQAFVMTAIGVQPFLSTTLQALQQVQTTAKQIQQNIDSLKGS